MKNTHTLILSLKKRKKNKNKTMIGWQTFNNKQIPIILPKLKKVVDELNTVIKKIIRLKQQQIIKLLITALNQNKKMENLFTNAHTFKIKRKVEQYSSFFNSSVQEKKQDIQIKIGKNSSNIMQLFNLYLYITKILINISKTEIRTLVLPVCRTTYTVLKSPHADKKAREQFAKEIYKAKLVIDQYVPLMKYLNNVVHCYTKAFLSGYQFNLIY